MALLKTLTLIDNFKEIVVITNAYIRVQHCLATKHTFTIFYSIMRSAEGQVLCERTSEAPLDLEGPNPIKQAYEHLKTLPEFEGAVDC